MRFRFAAFFACVLMLSGCAETQLISHYAKKWTTPDTPAPRTSGNYKIGKPYKIGNIWYTPREDFNLVETGIASWYGPDFHGNKTANGEIYDKYELTAAHRTLQMPSIVRVTNLENGRSIIVRINDRGPFARGRIIDMSKRGAELLGFINQGTARVKVEVLEQESRQIAEAAKQGIDTSRLTLSDLREKENIVQARPAQRRPVQVASASDDSLPESLQTPTITVDELNNDIMPIAPASQKPVTQKPVPGHVTEGRFMPDAVVSYAPVKPTGIFVQAGSFGVKENADRLQQKLSVLGRVETTPIVVNGRQYYRVRLGPFNTVADADKMLARVIALGGDTAKVVKP